MKQVKYYKFKKTSGRLNFPPAFADSLDWEHSDSIVIEIYTSEKGKSKGKKGLFFYKNEE